MRQPLDESHRITAFLTRVLKNAGHTRCMKSLQKLLPLTLIRRIPIHRHRLP